MENAKSITITGRAHASQYKGIIWLLKDPNFSWAVVFSLSAVALTQYEQDVESLLINEELALADDGWLVFYTAYDNEGVYLFGFGAFSAPNSNNNCCNGFSRIRTGEAGAKQGVQYIEVLSHTVSLNPDEVLESEFFQKQTIEASDIGNTWRFEYDAKLPATLALGSNSTADAFVRIIDPLNGFAVTHLIKNDSTSLSQNIWESRAIEFTFDNPDLAGQEFQFGMVNRQQNLESTSVYYDNIRFFQTNVEVPMLPLFALSILFVGLVTITAARSATAL